MLLVKVCVAFVFHLRWVLLGVDIGVVVRGDVGSCLMEVLVLMFMSSFFALTDRALSRSQWCKDEQFSLL